MELILGDQGQKHQLFVPQQESLFTTRGPLYSHVLWVKFNPGMDKYMCNNMYSNVWDEITYTFPNSTVEVREWTIDFIQHFIVDVITYPCWY